MALVKIEIPESAEGRKSLVEDLEMKIRCSVTGPFADALFDVRSKIKKGDIDDDGTIWILTGYGTESKIVDKARVASIEWTGALREVAEAIYWETRS